MISCRVAALTVLLSTASTLTLARTEELPKEEARSEEVDVEASEEAVSIESTASAEALAFVQATTMPEDDEWHFIVAPYLWLVDTSITMRIGPIVQEVDVPFDAVLSQLKGAFVIHFEANKKRWGAVTDFQYVSAAKGGALLGPIPRPETWPYLFTADAAAGAAAPAIHTACSGPGGVVRPNGLTGLRASWVD